MTTSPVPAPDHMPRSPSARNQSPMAATTAAAEPAEPVRARVGRVGLPCALTRPPGTANAAGAEAPTASAGSCS